MILAGLDIETTGLDLNEHHRLIQVGIHIPKYELKIVHDVHPVGLIVYDPEAMEVNKFTIERVTAADRTPEVDQRISRQLFGLGLERNSLTAVGWNVGAFDIAFLKDEMPYTASFFSHRVIDLTGIAILHEMRTGIPYREMKERYHRQIATVLGRNERHDALYDAEAALIALEFFKTENFNK